MYYELRKRSNEYGEQYHYQFDALCARYLKKGREEGLYRMNNAVETYRLPLSKPPSLATVFDMAASRAELPPVLGFRPLQLAESIKATDRVSTGVGEAA